jgi:hypothetical protein
MKRQSKKPKNKRKSGPEATKAVAEGQQKENRRAFLVKLRNGAIAAAVIAGAGWYVTTEFTATAKEADLSRIGNGVAAVVQIHDPQCPQCVALQRQTRKAFDAFDDDELVYLVANLKSPQGQQFAAKHQVGHATLLLFDARGKKHEVLVGPNQAANLERLFRRHIERVS